MTEVEEKTEFTFDELSERAKDKARDEYRSDGYLDYEWWDTIYEDAVHMGELIGIEIGTTTCFNKDKKPIGLDIDIFFSGFSSQGDGASFKGSYSYEPDAVQKVQAECNDEELIRIAQELTLLQLTRRLRGLSKFSAVITTHGYGSHSAIMQVEVYEYEDEGEAATIEDDVTQLMRDFADWIYDQLEDEYDYLMSDEYVDELLNDGMVFNEEGSTI